MLLREWGSAVWPRGMLVMLVGWGSLDLHRGWDFSLSDSWTPRHHWGATEELRTEWGPAGWI